MRPLIRPSVPLRQIFLVALPALLLLAALTGVYWWHLYSSGKDLRQATLDNAIYRAHQVNSAVSDDVSMLFFNADEATQNLVEFYTQNPIEQFSKQAEVLTHRFPEGSLLQLAVIGPDGFLKFSNLGTDTKLFLGEREHFKVHVEKTSGELFISKPLMARSPRSGPSSSVAASSTRANSWACWCSPFHLNTFSARWKNSRAAVRM